MMLTMATSINWWGHYSLLLDASFTGVELLLLLLSIFGLLWFTTHADYCLFLVIMLSLYIFFLIGLLMNTSDWVEIYYNGTFIFDKSIIMNKIIVSGFGLHFLLYLYFEININKFIYLEGSFFSFLIIWCFLISLHNFNLFVLFIIMEMITLVIIVATTIYILVVGSKLLQPVLYFFVLNVMVSTFYVFGCTLQLYISLPAGPYTVSYSTFLQTWEVLSTVFYNVTHFSLYSKILISFILLVFFFKITLAPFSIWVNSIYKQLPFLFLCLIMTVYKIVFCIVCLSLIFGTVDLIFEWHTTIVELFLVLLFPSFFLGCLAFRAQDLKTILALTTVSQFSYILSGFIMSNVETIQFSFFYLLLYCFQLFGIFGMILWLKPYISLTTLQQFFLLKNLNRNYAFLFFLIFFNLAGIPPLLGFFLKYWLFLYFYNAGFFMLALIGLVSGFLMTIIYLQFAIQLFYPNSGYLDVLKQEHTKRDFLHLSKNKSSLWIYKYINNSFFGLGFMNLSLIFFIQVVLEVVSSYSIFIFYRVSNSPNLILDTEHFVEVDILKQTQLQTLKSLQNMTLKWHPNDVYPILKNNKRLEFLLYLEQHGCPLIPDAEVCWLYEFGKAGIDYSSFNFAQLQLGLINEGGERLCLEDFEPFFKKEKPFKDLVFIIEKFHGSYNLRNYEEYINARYLYKQEPRPDIPHSLLYHYHVTKHDDKSVCIYEDLLQRSSTLDPFINFYHHSEMCRQSINGFDFDTDILWYHVDQQQFKKMCQQLIDCQISYSQFIEFLLGHGMGLEYYAHYFKFLEPPRIIDWIKVAEDTADVHMFREFGTNPHDWQYKPQNDAELVQHLNKRLDQQIDLWKYLM